MQAILFNIVPIVLMLGLFYLMIFLPEKKRKKKYQDMLGDLSLNDEIMTKGGIMGRVVNIQEEFVILESGPDRARIKLAKNGISYVIKSKEEKDTKSE
ncbi:preprotein translocase subunit YajC [Clostridium senegalense]|uniref:Preprotein translocase subunit YajC n=1 Tax=Clostridium senegalense TaxID=1465809 RepID=A0A6M0GZE3_9CLOT|nr:preprotein translocase subunit YajC [Clostridium senegalense]NEU03885.1 preprotein translocase subunit YajC [Clostridium senegalense]